MESINEIESRMKQECNEFKELLKYMHECYDKMSEGDSDAVYEKDVIIGFGNRVAHAKGGAATYTALEDAITYILEQEYEEYEEEETKPIGRIVKSYKFEDNCGNISVQGYLNSGEFFVDLIPTDYYSGSFGIWKNEEDFMDDDADAICEIQPCESKWLLMWEEILDDYAKVNGEYADKVDEWKKAVYEKVVK